MLQDLSFGHLDNQYHESFPKEKDILLCMRGKDILICRNPDNTLQLPTWEQAASICESWHTWGGMQTYGMGFYEYFCLAEELGALPLPVVA